MDKPRIIFMGTPDFAVPSLAILLQHNWPVVAVITAPDRKRGRGQQLSSTPVKEYAQAHNLPVLQPTNLKDPAFVEELRTYRADLQVVVAFRMLPEVVWAMPPLGTFNLHASLLPQYRGAAPINWAIINGETETGVTTFFLQHKIDTGNIILQEKEPIYEDDTAGTLHDRLMVKGSRLVLATVEKIASGTVQTQPQPAIANLKTAPKLNKEICRIDWQRDFHEVRNHIRGLSPYPAAWTTIGNTHFKIFAVEASDYKKSATPGTWLCDHKKRLLVRCRDKWAQITELQMAGKKRLPVAEFLKGNPLTELPAPD